MNKWDRYIAVGFALLVSGIAGNLLNDEAGVFLGSLAGLVGTALMGYGAFRAIISSKQAAH